MRRMTFDEYWAQSWKKTNQPAVFDAAMCEIAMNAWNNAVKSAAAELVKSEADIRLMAGELNAGEMRTTKAVLAGCRAEVLALAQLTQT